MQIWGLCDEYNNVQSFSSIQKRSSEIFHFLEFYINLCPRCDLLIALTTASLNVGWVPRCPGAFSISSQLLHETAPRLPNPGNPAMTPLLEGKKGTHHTDMIYTVEMGGGGQPKNYAQTQNIAKNKHKGSMCMWTTEDHWLHRLTTASSKHALVVQVHERTQQNAKEHRPLPDALVPVPLKTLLGTKEHH